MAWQQNIVHCISSAIAGPSPCFAVPLQEAQKFSAIDYTTIDFAAKWLVPGGSVAQAVRRPVPPLGSRVRASVTQCGFYGGQNGVWVGFFIRVSPVLLCAKFHSAISPHLPHSFHFIPTCDGAFGRLPCYSQTFNKGATSHLIPRPALCRTRVDDTYEKITPIKLRIC